MDSLRLVGFSPLNHCQFNVQSQPGSPEGEGKLCLPDDSREVSPHVLFLLCPGGSLTPCPQPCSAPFMHAPEDEGLIWPRKMPHLLRTWKPPAPLSCWTPGHKHDPVDIADQVHSRCPLGGGQLAPRWDTLCPRSLFGEWGSPHATPWTAEHLHRAASAKRNRGESRVADLLGIPWKIVPLEGGPFPCIINSSTNGSGHRAAFSALFSGHFEIQAPWQIQACQDPEAPGHLSAKSGRTAKSASS